jgi:hypothetical protein
MLIDNTNEGVCRVTNKPDPQLLTILRAKSEAPQFVSGSFRKPLLVARWTAR